MQILNRREQTVKTLCMPPTPRRNNMWLNSQFGSSDAKTVILSKCDQVTDRQISECNGAYGTDRHYHSVPWGLHGPVQKNTRPFLHPYIRMERSVPHCSCISYRTGWSSDNALDLYSTDAWLEPRPTYRQAWWGLSWFSRVPPLTCRNTSSIGPPPLLPTSFPIHNSSVILSFNAIYIYIVLILTASKNKQPNLTSCLTTDEYWFCVRGLCRSRKPN